MIIVKEKIIEIYQDEKRNKPFVKWIESLTDKSIRYRIKERLDRVALGNKGDHKFLEQGVYELRLNFGSGYRIYYGERNDKIILLLCGGNKNSQIKDIDNAIRYYKDYLRGMS